MTSAITVAIHVFGSKNILVRMRAIPLSLMGFIPGVAFENSDELKVRTNFTIGARYAPGKKGDSGWIEDYKVEFVPLDSGFGKKKSMYTSDFSSSWEAGHAQVFSIHQDGDEVSYRELQLIDFEDIDLNRGLY